MVVPSTSTSAAWRPVALTTVPFLISVVMSPPSEPQTAALSRSRHYPSPSMMPTSTVPASSISSSVTVIGGAMRNTLP